jgi:short-subunit dehydrogenase involved in D-alanine esterification of teichoic acids
VSQRILITAAASGIGLEIARAFAATGAKVFITDINAAALEAATKTIPGLLTGVCRQLEARGHRSDDPRCH